MDIIKVEILGIPKPKQSARFRIAQNKAGKQFIRSYQKKEVVDNEANIAYIVMQQLPKDFIPFDKAVAVKVEYVFPPPSGWSKKKILQLKNGEIIYKDTKPDLTDNLNKGLIDALSGIVYVNDSRIAEIYAVKYYGLVPKTIITFNEL